MILKLFVNSTFKHYFDKALYLNTKNIYQNLNSNNKKFT